jgi:acetyl/propionyl-CoA carboxylase alpha subunit
MLSLAELRHFSSVPVSVFLDEKTRQNMGKEAVQLARAVGYYSAGN